MGLHFVVTFCSFEILDNYTYEEDVKFIVEFKHNFRHNFLFDATHKKICSIHQF